jgi:DNA-binding NarL/FixJ family response regulator
MSEPIRVFLVEDVPRILDGLSRLIEGTEGLCLAGRAASGEEALARLGAAAPDVVLCDLGLPGIDGIETTRQIRFRWPAVEVLILTVFDEDEKVLGAVRAGAAGYLLKGGSALRLAEAIREVHAGGSVIQPSLARILLRQFHAPEVAERPAPTALSPRETEILELIAKGLTNPEAAQALGLSRATVRTHLEHIYEKLEVTNRTEAVAEGIRRGLVSP